MNELESKLFELMEGSDEAMDAVDYLNFEGVELSPVDTDMAMDYLNFYVNQENKKGIFSRNSQAYRQMANLVDAISDNHDIVNALNDYKPLTDSELQYCIDAIMDEVED